MGAFVIFNGKVAAEGEVLFSPLNRSFRYGDGFFESIRCRQGYPLWADYHFDRIKKSASLLRMKLPAGFKPIAFEEFITQLLHLNGHRAGARVRFSFFRQDGGLYRPEGNDAHFLIESSELPAESYALNKKGLIMGFYPDHQKYAGQLGQLKTSSALLYVLASAYAQEKKWDDVFISNTEGFVAEASSSNVFMVEGEKIFTPSIDQGCVDGVMRRVILDLGIRFGYKVTECAFLPQDLQNAEEVFITNAVSGINWVKGIGLKRYYHDVAGQLIQNLEEAVKDFLSKKNDNF
jgi:branched-chain amino acid aminotransferase